MIAVGREDALGFVVQPLLHFRAAEIRPQAAFGLEIKTQFVGGFKRGFGRAPRMETNAVQAVILAGLDDFFPRRDIHRRITRERKFPAVMCEPEVDDAAVDEQVFVVVRDFAETESDFAGIVRLIAFERNIEMLECGMEFIPFLRAVAKGNRSEFRPGRRLSHSPRARPRS